MKKQQVPMEVGFRRVGAASCRVQICEAVPKQMRARTREIIEVKTAPEHRGRGYATTLMHSVCREADEANFVLILMPRAYHEPDEEGLSDSNLEGWYRVRFGFQTIQDANPSRGLPLILGRMPGATPKVGLQLSPVVRAVVENARG